MTVLVVFLPNALSLKKAWESLFASGAVYQSRGCDSNFLTTQCVCECKCLCVCVHMSVCSECACMCEYVWRPELYVRCHLERQARAWCDIYCSARLNVLSLGAALDRVKHDRNC